jgi:hypothetical protein
VLSALCDRLAATSDVDPSARLQIDASDLELTVQASLADGRFAIRHVRVPERLFATVEALVVTPHVQSDTESPPGGEPTPSASPSIVAVYAAPPANAALQVDASESGSTSSRTSRAPVLAQPSATGVATADAPYTRLELGGTLVGRISRAPTYLATGFSLYTGLHIAHWMLSLNVRWDALETLARHAPHGFEMDSVGAGFWLTRNVVETRLVALQLGGGAQLLAQTQSIEATENETTQTAADLRLGLQSRLLLGRAPLRFLMVFEAELSPLRVMRTLTFFEPLPAWSLSLGFGAAWEAR